MITIHHLAFSRSTRIIWLMEELGLAYDLVRYERTETFRAPPALAAVHPLGKAPVIRDGELVLAESAVILTYLNTRYGEGRLAPPPGSEAWWVHEEWLQYVESTAALPIMMTRIGAITGGLPEATRTFIGTTLGKTLDNIAGGVSGRTWLMGESFSLADIQMSYILDVAHRSALLDGHPAIVAYLDRLKARPAFARAIAAGGSMMAA